jgi:SAM-dependent methyltransferase
MNADRHSRVDLGWPRRPERIAEDKVFGKRSQEDHGNTPYSSTFFSVQQSGSIDSAEIIAPLVLSLFNVSSVVDVGCGVGGWLKVFERHGVTDYLGIDGNYVPREMLKIPIGRFCPEELTLLSNFERSFDLACSLEVGEHLPENCADQFVTALVRFAPVVLFSAAIPRQGGTAHVNEKWATYWAEKFAGHGYVAVDCIRPKIYGNPRVEWWYRQNALIFCRPERCPAGYEPASGAYELNRVDPSMIEHLFMPDSGTEAIRTIRRVLPVLGAAILRRLKTHWHAH